MVASTLFANRPTRTAMRMAQLAALALVALAATVLPFAGTRLPNFPFFLPGVLTTAVMIDLFIAYLLYGQFIVSGAPAMPVLAAAFVLRSVFAFGYTVASPGVILGDGHLLCGQQAAPWMLVLWHLAFPLVVAAYAVIEHRRAPPVSQDRVLSMLGLFVAGTLAFGGVAIGAILLGHDALPQLIEADDYRRAISTGIAPAIVVLNATVLAAAIGLLRARSVIQLWLSVAMLALLLDAALIVAAAERYTLGWYASHLMGLCGSAILLAALLHAMTLLYAQLAAVKDGLAVLAETDGLTGLANRRCFDAALHREWLRAARERTSVALLMVDLDRFKSYNDRLGHPAGDECLRRVARAIAAMSRRPADLAARYGGEEFAVILPDTDRTGARHIADELRRAVLALAIDHPQGNDGKVTVSIGIAARLPAPGEAESTLLAAADAALYRAKNEGRDRAVAEGDPRIATAA